AANAFQTKLQEIGSIGDLIHAKHLRDDLVAVAGVSAKARKYLTDSDIDTILAGIVDGIPPDQQTTFHQDIFLRYMLTKGASFDGEMRNVIGATAQRKIVRLLFAKFKQQRVSAEVFLSRSKRPVTIDDALTLMQDERTKVGQIAWKKRVLL